MAIDRAAYMREWRRNHPESAAATSRRYWSSNKDRVNAERRDRRPPRLDGAPRRPRVEMTTEQRFCAKVDTSAGLLGCWLWTGAQAGRPGEKYGQTGQGTMAHRAAYELLVGPIPDGHVLDHLCRVHLCVNPAHLEPVTNRENVIRGNVARAALMSQVA